MAPRKPAAKKQSYQPASKKGAEVKETMVAYAKGPARTLQLLGARSSVLAGTEIREEKDFIDLIKKGVPRKSLDLLLITTGLTNTEMASVMHTTDRTLRRYKPGKLLNPEQSERVIEIARLYSRGEEVFGNMEAFREWMDAEILSFGQRKPKEFIDTSMGIELLMEELGRIEHGIFS